MPEDDERARKERARRLREEIARRTEEPASPAARDEEPSPPETPREFVDRMAEEEQKREQQGTESEPGLL
jgi:hypothetical protein